VHRIPGLARRQATNLACRQISVQPRRKTDRSADTLRCRQKGPGRGVAVPGGGAEGMAVWADTETNIDYINFSTVADSVVELIEQAQGKPLSIGVSGAWGVGKSSLVMLTREALERREREQALAAGIKEGDFKSKYIFVSFNAWLYQGYDDARAALMEAIAVELAKVAEERNTGIKKTQDFLSRIDWFRLASMTAGSARRPRTWTAARWVDRSIRLSDRPRSSGRHRRGVNRGRPRRDHRGRQAGPWLPQRQARTGRESSAEDSGSTRFLRRSTPRGRGDPRGLDR